MPIIHPKTKHRKAIDKGFYSSDRRESYIKLYDIYSHIMISILNIKDKLYLLKRNVKFYRHEHNIALKSCFFSLNEKRILFYN